MKSTSERLEESYCRPKTEEEWRKIGVSQHSFDGNHTAVVYLNGKAVGCDDERAELNGYTEIPVTRFLDLLHDMIVPWRLEEDGFVLHEGWHYQSFGKVDIEINLIDNKFILNSPSGHAPLKGITTYTDLITLIRLIG